MTISKAASRGIEADGTIPAKSDLLRQALNEISISLTRDIISTAGLATRPPKAVAIAQKRRFRHFRASASRSACHDMVDPSLALYSTSESLYISGASSLIQQNGRPPAIMPLVFIAFELILDSTPSIGRGSRHAYDFETRGGVALYAAAVMPALLVTPSSGEGGRSSRLG